MLSADCSDGAVAQLGERLVCNQEATGSIPVSSTRIQSLVVSRSSLAEIMMNLPKVDDWPMWLQVLVFGPPAIINGILLWVWWPKSDREWRRFGITLACLIAFYLTMYLVFGFK